MSDDERNGAMPIRVIDVRDTIENREAGGIHFTRSRTWHVISHTWSAQVRAFSNTVGEKQKLHCLDSMEVLEHRQGYEALFQSAGFHCDPAYQKLIELLLILEMEQVRWVWFDAVCINQADNEEKDHEIQHMGTFYQNSKGCYVLQHGIGKGFELLLKDVEVAPDASNSSPEDGDSRLPRWFTRAWTLQEWVLPPWLTFIIDLSSEECLCTIASILLRKGSSCFCCNYDTSISPDFLQKCLLEHADVHALQCQKSPNAVMQAWKCLCPAPHFREVPGKSHWYFADDLGYSLLLRLKFQIPKAFNKRELMAETEFELTKRIGVNRSIQRLGTGNLQQVIWDISLRDCSNAEDRVLSVLKLLGVQNAFQVRTGKPLNAQLLELARRLGDEESTEDAKRLLVYLALVDGFGNSMPGMSWMPHFEIEKGSWQEGARLLAPEYFIVGDLDLNALEPKLTHCEVSNMGMLQLEGDVCTGHLEICNDGPRTRSHAEWRRGPRVSRCMVLKLGGKELMFVHAHMYTKLAQRTTCIIESASPLQEWTDTAVIEICIAFEATGLESVRSLIPVWLVKMGALTAAMVWLVCIGHGDERPLHKIGYLRTSYIIGSDSPFVGSQKRQCCIGGLGPRVSSELLLYVEDAGGAVSSP